MTTANVWKDALLWAGCIVVGCVAIFAIYRIFRRSKNEGSSGCCGYCGYSVQGLTNMECPECGKDLREVGITRAYQLSKGYLVMLVVALTCVALLFFTGFHGCVIR